MLYYLGLIIISLILFPISRSPITKLFFKILVFLASSLVIFEQTLFFLAKAYLIVYVGAIAILFIFVLKLLPKEIHLPPIEGRLPTASLLLLGVSFLVLSPQKVTTHPITQVPLLHQHSRLTSFTEISDLVSFGFLVFAHYPLTLFLLTVLLFVVLVGLLAVSL